MLLLLHFKSKITIVVLTLKAPIKNAAGDCLIFFLFGFVFFRKQNARQQVSNMKCEAYFRQKYLTKKIRISSATILLGD